MHTLWLPDGCRMDRVLLVRAPGATADAAGEGAAGRGGSGTVAIGYSAGGRSASYAVGLSFADADGAAGSGDAELGGRAWLVFSGLTGHVTLLHDEDKTNKVLAMLATGRPDAH